MTEGHYDTTRAQLLDKEERIRALKPTQLLESVGGITKDMTCIDYGSGTGTFSFPMVRCVGDTGLVYAVDDSEIMLDHIRAKPGL